MESETTEVGRTRTCMFIWAGEDLPSSIGFHERMTYLGYVKEETTITGYVEFDKPLRPAFIKLLLTGGDTAPIILTRYKQGTIIEKRARAQERVNKIGGEIITCGIIRQTVKAPKKKRVYLRRVRVYKPKPKKSERTGPGPYIDVNYSDALNHEY